MRPVTSKSRGICRYYNTSRGCYAGDNCKFLHGEHEKLTPYDKSKTCRYFAAGFCKRGEKCWFRHVPPANPTADTAESLICAICMEEPVTFGLLVECSHVFCIDCIRNWRGQGSSSDEFYLSHVHKTCPYCRTRSKFVIPSSHFYPSGHPGKAAIIERYKASLQRVPCKYFTSSPTEIRYCPFGRDCMYQHLNEDGTPYVFDHGVDHYMAQRGRHLPGIFRDAMTRSVFEYIHHFEAIWGPRALSEALPDELFDAGWELEQNDTDSESDVILALAGMVNIPDSHPDPPSPEPSQDPLTFFASINTPTLPPDPVPVPESSPIPTSLNVQSSEPLLHSIPSSPLSTSSIPSLIATSASGTEGNLSDVTNTSSLSDDGRPSQPINGPITSSDRMPRQSHPGALPSSLCHPQRAGCPISGTSVPASPVPSQRDDVESHSPLNPQAPQIEVSSVTEVGPTAGTQSATRDPPGEVSDTRQQDPPFMTDGRGRVVWSRSGVKRGSSPPATRSQDRAPNVAGDRE